MALTPEQVASFDVGSGIGMTKLQQLLDQGATREQITQIARRAPVIGERVRTLFPELASQSTVSTLPPLRTSELAGSAIDPALRPYLQMGLQRAEQLFFGQPPSLYPGQMYVSPSEQTLTALQQQEALARQAAPALEASQQAYMQSLGGLGQTAGGAFLGGSPYREQMIAAATRPLMQQFQESTLPALQSAFSRAGRYGSGAQTRAISQAQEAATRAIGDVTAGIVGQDYARERALQQQAQTALTPIATQAPQIFGQQFLPGQQLAQVGAAREAIAAQPLQEAITRYQYGQQAPYQQLQGFLSSVYGTPMAGSQYAPQNVQTNQLGQTLGGALVGSQLAGMIGGKEGLFGFTPQQTQLGGAALGALGGLLF